MPRIWKIRALGTIALKFSRFAVKKAGTNREGETGMLNRYEMGAHGDVFGAGFLFKPLGLIRSPQDALCRAVDVNRAG
ncbi:MAG: hypothetical protein RLZZ436_878 [Planctomycetota bacterium]|jgi:hypothetical protein